MPGECAFSCRHPLWGGAGACITTDDPAVDDSCVCDEGYASRDSFGNPSCVPLGVLVGSFMAMATSAATATAFTWWHLAQHTRLSRSRRATRKAVVRLRVIVSGSVYTSGTLVLFCVAAARGGASALWDGGMFYVTYGVAYPSIIFCIVHVGELWLGHLPPQLLKPGSVLETTKRLATEYNAFLWAGFACSAGFALVSILSLIFGQRAVRRAVHFVLMVSCVLAGVGFTATATFLVRAISAAEAKRPQAWHKRAKEKVRMEAGALIVASTIYACGSMTLEFTGAGKNTPLILYAIMLTVGMAGTAGVIHFSKPAERTARSPGSSDRLPKVLSQIGKANSWGKLRSFVDGALPALDKPLGRTDAAAPRAYGVVTAGKHKNKVVPV